MAKLFPFKRSEVIHNTIKTYPKTDFFVYDTRIYLNNMPAITGTHCGNVGGVDTGFLSVYEENVDRRTSQYIYPYVTKDSTLRAFKTIRTTDYNSDYSYGDVVTGSYPLKTTLTRTYYAANATRAKIDALQNILNANVIRSPHYIYSSSLGDKSVDTINLLEVPSLFYGSQIKPGSVYCKYYISGSLIGELHDYRKNGELVQVAPVGSNESGSVAGVILYKEGCMLLTGAWNITNEFEEPYIPSDATLYKPRWVYFGSTGSAPVGADLWNLPSSSFDLYFEGINYVNTLTMFCQAPMGQLNCSQNPTWLNYGQALTGAFSGSKEYMEYNKRTIKNIVKTKWDGKPTGSFQKITYINSINIHDKDGNIIARAKMATPVKKTEERAYTFKLKLDIG